MANSECGSGIRENSAVERQPLNSHEFSYGLSRLLLGLVLAVGGAIVWSYLVQMSSAWVANRLIANRNWESRDIQYRESGEPVIQQWRNVSLIEVSREEYRTLDGEPVTIAEAELRRVWHPTWSIGSFPARPNFSMSSGYGGWRRPLADVPVPLPWSVRLWDCSVHRGNRRPEHWYLIWPDHPGGSAYLANCDATTKSLRGYLSPSGFRSEKLAETEGWPAWDRDRGEVARLITDPPGYSFPQTGDSLFLLSEDRDSDVGMLLVNPARDAISVINLTRRSIEVVRLIRDVPLLGFSAMPESRSELQESGITFSQQVLQPRLILRWPDHLEFVTPMLKTLSKVTLPEELRERSFQLSELKAGGFVAEYLRRVESAGERSWEIQLVWFDDSGRVTQRRTVLQPHRVWNLTEKWILWRDFDLLNPMALMPWKLSALWFDTEDIAQPAWSISVCLLSGVPFAIACWRRQRRVVSSRFERLAWLVLVYLFGPVGWIAFVSHRAWPSIREPMALATGLGG
ncbi:MAG: hypothetical protein ACKV2Q_06250 [Planctomycetaceae bacterium]